MFDCDICFQPFDEGDLSKRAREFTNKRNSKIELTARLGKGVASIPIPVLLTEVEIKGILRIQIKFSTTFPHMDLIEFGFLEKPTIDFVLRPLKGMDLMDAPGLSTFLHETIDWALESSIVNPNMIKFQLLDWWTGSGGGMIMNYLMYR
jgi:Ca2+-dependent lipid-binding protein